MLNVAVIGCGYWGPNLIRNFYSLSDCKVKMVCDLDSGRLEHMRKLFCEVETTTNPDDVINDPQIDAVAIATPVRHHYEMAKKCLQAKKHTLIEKPMASSSLDCKNLIGLSQKQNRILMLGHTFIYSPAVQRVKEIVRADELGKILYISSRRLNLGLYQTDINVAWDLAPHDISIILFVLDTIPVSVNCQGKAHIHPPIEDITTMEIDFDNGPFVTIRSSWLDPYKVRDMIIVGTKRMLVYNDLEPIEKIKIFDKRVETPPYYDTFAEFHYSYHYGDVHSPYIQEIEPLKVECQHFLNCIKNNSQPDTGGLNGLQVVQILEAATRSLKKGGGKVEISDFAKV